MSTLTNIDAAVWRPVFAEHGVRLMPATCRAAAVWLWTALTCGELTDAPALADLGWSRVSIKSRLRTCRDLADRMPPALAARLLAFGQALLDSPAGR